MTNQNKLHLFIWLNNVIILKFQGVTFWWAQGALLEKLKSQIKWFLKIFLSDFLLPVSLGL